jgi:hypothetical protein
MNKIPQRYSPQPINIQGLKPILDSYTEFLRRQIIIEKLKKACGVK